MIIGYARTSTWRQEAGLEKQLEVLENFGCEKIYKEQVSSIYDRDKLKEAINSLQEGDIFVVTKLDRLARSVEHFIKISKLLEEKKVNLRILDLGLDTFSPTGKLILNIMASVAQFEREVMLERQRVGIKKAQQEGRMRGNTLPPEKEKMLIRTIEQYDPMDESSLSIGEMASLCGVCPATVYKKLKVYRPDMLTRRRATKALVIQNVFGGSEEAYNRFQETDRKRRKLAKERHQ